MLIVAIVFIVFALNHPEKSFPWNNTITWLLYGIYFLVTVVLLIAPKMKKWEIPVCRTRSSRVWGRHAPTRALRKLTWVEEVKSRMDKKFSRIENLWPRDDSCSQLIRSKQLLRNCFQIVKTHKASKEPFSSEVVVFTVSTTTFLFCFSCKRVRNMVYRLYETLLRLNNLTFNDV